jgi:branched-chain amino acid transport system permease protein
MAGLSLGSGLVDWLAVGMIAGALVGFLPASMVGRGRRRNVPTEAGAPGDVPTPSAPDVAATIKVSAPEEAGVGRASLLVCEDLRRWYGGVRALDGVSVTVRQGELLGLVGPNGSGKTTLVGLVSGSIRPTSGTIRVGDTPIAGLAPHQVAHLGVARTYQVPRPFPSMTLRDNVSVSLMFGRTSLALGPAREEADAFLELVGLRGRGDARPADINLHERQLLEMARALATRPRLLLLDEALAGLNPAEVDQAVEAVRRIHRSGITIIIVEHLLRVVRQLATRMVVLEQGRLLASGDPGTVMSDPEVIRAYLGKYAHA